MNSTPEQLRFPSIAGRTLRADFNGGGLSSDLGPLLLKGVDRQIGLTERINAALVDTRHASYITHTQRDLLAQRLYQIGCVTSLPGLDAQVLYEDIYCARGQAENFIKHLKTDLACDRTSCTSFMANSMRLLLHASAYVLHQQLRTQALRHTALSQAQPSTVIARLFKIAVQVRQSKQRITLHLPSTCPVK